MRRIALYSFVFLIFVCLAPARGEDASAVRAEGSAPLSADNIDVKKEALDQALRNAVSTALDALVKNEAIAADPAQSDSIEREIYSNPRDFILDYRIVEEGQITHMDARAPQMAGSAMPNQAGAVYYHVWIEANIDRAKLKGLVSRMTEGGATSFFRIVILGVNDYGAFQGLLTSLEGITVVNDISYDSFYRGNITLTARINGNGQGLSERIAREVSPRFIVASGGNRTILIKAAQEPPSTGR